MRPLGIVDVVCEGLPFEMGLAQGTALRERIRDARANMLSSLESFRLAQPPWMPYLVYRWIAERKSERFLAISAVGSFLAMSQQLNGIAKGAGLSRAAISLFNALEPLMCSVGGCTACPGACSAVAIRGHRSATGEPIIAHNFDFLPLVQPYYTVRESRPQTGHRAFEFTTAPLAGTVDGMNDAGLCIAYDYAFATDSPTAPAVPISMVITEALRRCRSVAEASEWIASQPRWGGALLMLADTDGDIASMELSSTRSHLRRPADGEDLLFHSNAFSSPHLREVQVPDDAVYTERAPTALRGRRLHQSSDERDRRYRDLLQATPIFGPDELAAVMGDHGAAGVPGEFTPCIHSSYWQTTACLQLYPRSRRMRVAYETACQARFQEIAW